MAVVVACTMPWHANGGLMPAASPSAGSRTLWLVVLCRLLLAPTGIDVYRDNVLTNEESNDAAGGLGGSGSAAPNRGIADSQSKSELEELEHELPVQALVLMRVQARAELEEQRKSHDLPRGIALVGNGVVAR